MNSYRWDLCTGLLGVCQEHMKNSLFEVSSTGKRLCLELSPWEGGKNPCLEFPLRSPPPHTPCYSYLMGPVWFHSRFATVVFSVSRALWVPVKSQLASALDNGRPLAPHLAHSDNDMSVPMVITTKSCQTRFLLLLQNTAFHFETGSAVLLLMVLASQIVYKYKNQFSIIFALVEVKNKTEKQKKKKILLKKFLKKKKNSISHL